MHDDLEIVFRGMYRDQGLKVCMLAIDMFVCW
jgi:hypothetical protein